MIPNYEMETMWRETAVAYFKAPSQNLSGWTEGNNENLSQDSKSPGEESNPELMNTKKHKARSSWLLSRSATNLTAIFS
jgi:hypothetical protein